MRIDLVSLFPELHSAVLGTSIPKRAAEKGLVTYHVTDIRDFGEGNYQKVDDRPFGGGPGMVMMPQVLAAATDAALAVDPMPARRLILSPVGRRLDQPFVDQLATEDRLLIVATHYEGYDERFVEEYELEEVSLGDFVTSGGELPALVLIDAVVRLIPGVLGHDDGPRQDSFAPDVDRLLEGPQYTRPREWRGRSVPDILMSGDHAKINAWRHAQRLTRTRARRPDLLPGE
ncbi:MAG: tRNA (guanosine(37)-N1)-methyltransferase TrmD [Planctomycetota bacterium]